MSKLLQSRLGKIGLPPGTAIHIGEKVSDEVRISIIDYDAEHYETITPDTADACENFADKKTVSWINVEGLHRVEVIEKICSCFKVHPLTVEDILNTGQRPKVDIYDNYLYLVVKMPEHDADHDQVNLEQVSFLLGENFLVTFQEKKGDTFEAVRTRLASNKGRIRKSGADYLLYALVDSVIDNYFVLLENVGEQIEDIEEELVVDPNPATLQKIHYLKREMILLRKSVWPLREVISSLQRDELPYVGESIAVYLKDLYDHTIQVLDTVETFRDIISGLLDIYLSSVSNRLNEIMKVLTIYAAIFIPLTFIAGVYGMNFNTAQSPFNMPELNWYFGYPLALTIMATVAGVLLVYFKRKNWL